MAFKIHSIDDNRVPGIEYLPAGAITPKVGQSPVLKLNNNTAVWKDAAGKSYTVTYSADITWSPNA